MCYIHMLVLMTRHKGVTLPADRRFLIAGSRLLSNNSEVELCQQNIITSRGYESLDGRWLSLTPQIVPLRTPIDLDFNQEDDEEEEEDHDEEESSGGLYSILQYSKFNRAWEWPQFHKTLRAWVKFREGKPENLG